MKQISGFFVLGLFSTAIDFIIYTILVYLNVNYVIAIIIGYSCGFVFNFFIGRKHIFVQGLKVDSFAKEFNLVLVINLIAVLLNIIIVYILYSYWHILNQIADRIIAIILVFFWNYFARKFFVYK